MHKKQSNFLDQITDVAVFDNSLLLIPGAARQVFKCRSFAKVDTWMLPADLFPTTDVQIVF